jgi:hypothetical protein
MSEDILYFVLAQLYTLGTSALRLSVAFASLVTFGSLVQFAPLRRWLRAPLLTYWSGWMTVLALAAGVCLGLSRLLLPFPNSFVDAGLGWSGGLLLFAGALWGASARSIAWVRCLLLLGLGLFTFWMPAFSRSDKLWVSVLYSLPVALCLSHFPLQLAKLRHKSDIPLFHTLWLGLMGLVFLIHQVWMYPQLQQIPTVGEFYPYSSLYDWFLYGFVILYSGNLYIDYWLNQGNRSWAIGWHYLAVIAALVCLWFNSNVFDSLAL